MRKYLYALVSLLTVTLLLPTFASALGTNGSFENGTAPGVFLTVTAPNTTDITGWSVDSGSVDYIGTYWPSSDGVRNLDLNGLAKGAVSQDVPTTVGATYTVGFDLSGNPDSRPVDDPLYSPTNKIVRVGASGTTTQDYPFDTSVKGNSLTDMKWEHHTYVFVATAATTTLSFASQIEGAFGPALDNVTIEMTAPAPTPVGAVCPEGTTMSASPVDTFVVDSASSTPTSGTVNLVNGQSYIVKASGTWLNTPYNLADAEFTSTTSWATFNDGYDVPPFMLGEGEFDLMLNGGFVNWGTYSATHEYSRLYTGTGSPLSAMIFDGDSNSGASAINAGWYGDNVGTLSVNVYACTPVEQGPAEPQAGKVHLFKFIDGEQAVSTPGNVEFPMYTTTFSAPFVLRPSGWAAGDVAYEASTGDALPGGSSYSAYEQTNTSLVGTTCDGTKPYALVGYSTGSSLSAAMAGATSTATPTVTVNGDQYIIVWNQTCQVTPPLKVHILKYLDGQKATSTSPTYQFPMTATWKTANLDGGATTTGTYVLGNNHGGAPDLYGADTAPMQAPANYSTAEITDSSSQVLPTEAACQPGKYRLLGYKVSSSSFADAATQATTTSASFAGLTADKWVIIYNETCPTSAPAPVLPVNACSDTSHAPAGYTLKIGKPGNESVILQPNTMFVGLGGNDTVRGPDGNYIICTGRGNTHIELGDGNDVIVDEGGNNFVRAGDGTHYVTTGNGEDHIELGDGPHTVNMGGGSNFLRVGNGDGTITGGSANDHVETGNGNHTITLGDGNNFVRTGNGTQNVTTGNGNDNIQTGNGNDTIVAGDGNNAIRSGGGNDTVTGGAGHDNIDGGPGTDVCNAGAGPNTVINCAP